MKTSDEKLRILCVHGVGHHPPGGAWEDRWRDAVTGALTLDTELTFVHLDDLFAAEDIDAWDVLQAVRKLAASALSSAFTRRQARGAISTDVRWTAGMVVQWVENESLRAATRARLAEAVAATKPRLILAHSLGSLVAYDTFVNSEFAALIDDRVFASFGSQIGNPFVIGNFAAGRIEPLRGAERWFHLYNRHDDVFTAPIRLNAPNFSQVETHFDAEGIMDHSAVAYLGHMKTCEHLWSFLEASHTGREFAAPRPSPRVPTGRAKPTRKALIVGINEYDGTVAAPLEGCVNDAYLVSALTQELGFEASEIRLLLDRRATAAAVRERLDWLLHDAREGDARLFYFSGHGTRMADYGVDEQIDHVDEALVTADFDWSPEHALIDNEFYEYYSQLDYAVSFTAVFDCCHSAGMTRGGARVRGIQPPPDIRHRGLRWNGERWVERDLEPAAQQLAGGDFGENFDRLNPALSSRRKRTSLQSNSFRLGQAMALRLLDRKEYVAVREAQDHHGPYLPLLVYACDEDELAYEETWGTTVHGAFTYFLAKTLREWRGLDEQPDFEKLVKTVSRRIASLRLPQHPQLVGPEEKRLAPVPLLAGPG